VERRLHYPIVSVDSALILISIELLRIMIISVFLGDITSAFRKEPKLENLLFDDFFNKAIHKAQPGWRRIIAQSALWGVPTPAFSTALSFFDGYRTELLPASLLQAQRDYFGVSCGILPYFDRKLTYDRLCRPTLSESCLSTPPTSCPRARIST
jgi:hypothetical protein